MKLLIISLITIFIILSINMSGFSKTLHVPRDYEQIQIAIDTAVDGDTVLVDKGTYTGVGNKNLNYKGKAITVKSEIGPDSTIIDCDNDGNLEGYGGVGISRTGKVRNPIGSTPEDYPYQCFKSNTEVRIRIPSRDVIYSSSATPDNPPEFSSEPTEPYATNGQELYE